MSVYTNWCGDASCSCLLFGNWSDFLCIISIGGDTYKSLLLICVGITYNTCHRFLNKNINKHLISVFSDDRGEAMSGPSAGRQEAGAPCTGESLCVSPTLTLFLLFPSSLSLFADSHFLRARKKWCLVPWGTQLLLTRGNLVSSRWLCAFLMLTWSLYTDTHKKSTYTSGPSPHLLSLQKLCIPLQFSPNDVLNKNYYFPYSNSCFTAHSSSPISAALPECLSKARIM